MLEFGISNLESERFFDFSLNYYIVIKYVIISTECFRYPKPQMFPELAS